MLLTEAEAVERLLAAAIGSAVTAGASPRQLNAVTYAAFRAAREVPAAGVGERAAEAGADIRDHEEALAAVRRCCGQALTDAGVVRALRERGLVRLASRLRVSSQRRNRAAHPDPALAADVVAALGGAPGLPEAVAAGDAPADWPAADKATRGGRTLVRDDAAPPGTHPFAN